MSQLKQECSDKNDVEDIRSIEGSERILETIRIATMVDGNAQGNEDNSANDLLKVPKQFFGHNLGYFN
jgi:hypothetical protein